MVIKTKERYRTWIAASFAGIVVLSLFFVVLSVPATHAATADPTVGAQISGAQAEATCDSAPAAPPCVGRSIKEVAKTVGDKVIKPTFSAVLIQGLLNITQFVTNRLAYEAALLVANGGRGQGSLFYKKSALEGFQEFGLEVAGEAVAELSDAVNSSLPVKLGLCLPPPSITLNLQLGIAQKYQPPKPRCDITEVTKNWSNFVSDTINTVKDSKERDKVILSNLAKTLQPGRNELSAAVKLNIEIDKEVEEKKQAEIKDRTSDKPAVKEVKDPVTGQTTTPAKVVENDFLDKIKKVVTGETTQLKASDFAQFGDAMPGLALTAASTFTNTLLSQLFNKIYKGLFEASPDSQDPFRVETVADTGQDPETFSSLFAPIPFATAEYNALTEFVVCPPQTIANRGLNNCVMDSNFLAAVTRGNSGNPLTVQEAITKENLLNGDWPLISPEDRSSNQDPLCYTFGFCYSNLVKLRKARILPIGWELAALRNNVSRPKTLQEVINEFDNCNQEGALDGAHPFCHLIDPNWVLKYPETQCRATVNGEVRLTSLSPGRQSVCADAPSCLGENSRGECTDGFGYCVREKNVWRFRGDECPAHYAGCLVLKSTTDDKQANFLIDTVDFSVCSQRSAGCQWYQTQKTTNAAGDFDWPIAGGDGSRLYLTRAARSCSEGDAGCSGVIPAAGTVLNMVRNPSFEEDEEQDGMPDGWERDGIAQNNVTVVSDQPAARGSRSVQMSGVGAANGIRQYVSVQPFQFYTLSYFATADRRGAKVRVQFYDEDGNPASVAGVSRQFLGETITQNNVVLQGCAPTPDNTGFDVLLSTTQDWKRAACVFVSPAQAVRMKVLLTMDSIRYDAIQLEPSETASTFVTGLSGGSNREKFVKIAPDYLACTGLLTDAPACASYAQMCQAQDVGCSLFTPDNGDPSVPVIASTLDACPGECVGYETFKQEKTDYEIEKFPLFFIPQQAKACTAEFIGCDSFTNLSSASEGGENVEHYTTLRACVTPQMADGTPQKTAASFFTWEGSDNAGYQLRSWQLLASNQGEHKAPCTKWRVEDQDELLCVENGAHLEALAFDRSCDEHADIFTNPDCREFYDAAGFVHYRRFSQTVSVSEACQPYRKDRSTQNDCTASGGFWDAEVGFCRYFGLSSESRSCPSAMSGCRSYTGGAGRNAATLLTETFESGTTAGYKIFPAAGQAELLISNESVATGGHSLRVRAIGGQAGVKTLHASLNARDESVAYDPTSEVTKRATCSNFNGRTVTPAGCEIDVDNDRTVDCIVGPGEHSCGTLVNKLVAGKTFTLSFWAKGTGRLTASFALGGSLGDPISLSNAWQVYTLGPVDTSAMQNFSKDSVLVFSTTAGNSFYLDNVVLKQVEENVALIKDSWVVSSTCDATPDGVSSPQYYLGCEAYRDHKGASHNLYQFTSLCSEKVVGCDKFIQTFETQTPYAQVYQMRCEAAQVVNGATPCEIQGVTYCTIANDRQFCTFDWKTALPEVLPQDGSLRILMGPETVVAPADRTVYFVDNGQADCSAAGAGCLEAGKPKHSQDLSSVESFTSAYVINDPDQYGDILCTNEELFCEEYASASEGNYYFKNPLNKTCDFRASVEIEGKKFAGWFRTGTSEPCDWQDLEDDNKYKPGTADRAYVIAGDQMAIWRNGDPGYQGWVGQCASPFDRCTEFIDIVDTEGGLKKDGTSYYFINNDRLLASQASAAGDCKGQISQKQGCALFNNRSKSERLYNASASYVLSTHANVLLSQSPNALVDPVSCLKPEEVKYTVSDATRGNLGLPNNDVFLCKNRCMYRPQEGDAILSNMATPIANNEYLERSCLTDADCPILKTRRDRTVSGECRRNLVAPPQWLRDDANTVVRVARDRSCSAWLACDSPHSSFNERTNKYESICDSIDLCVQGEQIGQTSLCNKWDPRAPEILTDQLYSKRDVTWNGNELSGFAIPNQLPVELYDQFNLNPEKVCVQPDGTYKTVRRGVQEVSVECVKDADCGRDNKCVSIAEQRLVYNAGACDSSRGNGEQCSVGRCSNDSDRSCFKQGDCGRGNQCVVGYCQQATDQNCATNADCSNGFSCDPLHRVCVDVLAGAVPCTINGGGPTCANQAQSCTVDATTAKGACFNNRCLTDIIDTSGDGLTDPITFSSSDERKQSCRGYPEVDSPYPASVVTEWITPKDPEVREDETVRQKGFDDPDAEPRNTLSRPYTFRAGYQDAKTCAVSGAVGDPQRGKPVDCDCSYDKVVYGKNVMNLFTQRGGDLETPPGLCLSGPYDGQKCESDADCSDFTNPQRPDAGTCLKRTAEDTFYGWSGYCIERDSSIPLFGSPEEKDHACLTWLPVDQLTGATDLYAKYTRAGYSVDKTLYCADIDVSYDIKTTKVGCAETVPPSYCGWDSTDSNNEADDHVRDDRPAVHCPFGFFAVMTVCDELSESGHKIANFGAGDCEEGDNDYPYFCVPFNSQTEDGTVCSVPNDAHFTFASPHAGWGTGDSHSPVFGYAVGGTFSNKYEFFKTCTVKGVSSDHVTRYLPEQTDYPTQVLENGPGDIYYGLKYNYDQFTSCSSLVQTSTSRPQEIGSGLDGYNVAWTDRVWKEGYTIKPDDSSWFSYQYDSGKPPFGQLKTSLESFKQVADPSPPKVSMCRKANQAEIFPEVDAQNAANLACTVAGYVPEARDARGYYRVSLGASGFEQPDTTLCKDDECKCERTVDCNWINSQDPEDPGRPISCGERRCSNDRNKACVSEDDCEASTKQVCGVGLDACPDGETCKKDDFEVRGECEKTCKPVENSPLVCIGGPREGQPCVQDRQASDAYCQFNQCMAGECLSKVLAPEPAPAWEASPVERAQERLRQLFARSLKLVTFDDGIDGVVAADSDTKGNFLSPPASLNVGDPWFWDARRDGDGFVEPTPPTVISLGACAGTKCREGREGAITVNDQDEGEVFGKGSKRVNVSFFVKADSNQMPVRKIVVDWGDGRGDTPREWPTDSQSGSTASDNFYKNHRGLDVSGNPICRSDAGEFGESPQACSSSYVVFSHNYVCTAGMIEEWKDDPARNSCKRSPDGRLLNSPCTDGPSCNFQPRVHVLDNWGWCTGFCNAGDDETNGCFSGTPQNENNECRIDKCPSGGDANGQCPDENNPGTIVNPWINYDGFVVVEPEE